MELDKMNSMIIRISLLLLIWLPFQIAAQEISHIRFVEGNEEWQGELQTAVTRYRNQEGQYVDLIAAIHIGDQTYYDELNNYFAKLDELLFELVADLPELSELPNTTTAQLNSQSGSPLSLIQTLLANYLQLDFQLSGINYAAKNFRHADLSASELREIMASKDESFFTMFLTMAAAQMSAEREGLANDSIRPTAFTLVSLMNALSAENQAQALKFLLAQELARSGGLTIDAEIESGLTILGDRNQAALLVLEESLAEGNREVGLFYGAAHMPGLARAMTNDMGFEMESQQWITAWAIP